MEAGSLGYLEKEMATHSSVLACLENSVDRGAWWATGHGVAKNRTLLGSFNGPEPGGTESAIRK